MKRLSTFLLALMLMSIGANAQVDYSSYLANGTWSSSSTCPSLSSAHESYNSSGNNSAGKILYCTVSDLPAGTYTVSFYVAANAANVSGVTSGTGIAQAYVATNGTVGNTQSITVGTVTGMANSWSSGTLCTLSATLTDAGSIEFGIQNVETGGNWYVCEGKSLVCTSETLTEGDVAHYCVAWDDEWSITGNSGGSFQRNVWSTEGETSGMVTPFIEYWVGGSNNLDDATISHTQIASLTAGYYTVSIDARAFNEGDEKPVTTGTVLFYAKGDGDSQNVSVDLATGTDNLFNGHFEYYGTYSVIANVSTARTLDVGFTINNTNSDWVSWKNLEVEYMGTTLSTSVGTPELGASYAKPGSTVTITFPNCIGTSTLTLDESKTIAVGSTSVTPNALNVSGITATVTFTMPENVEYGQNISITIPANLLYWSGTSIGNAETTLSISTPIMADQMGVYIESMYFEGMLLSRGDDYGTRAKVDRYGVPVDIEFGDDGKATVRYVDSDNYLYGDAWAYSDNKAISANPGYYTLVSVTLEGETNVYQFQGGNNVTGEEDWPMYVYDEELTPSYDGNNTYHLANNGIYNDNYKDVKQIYWKILTRTERDAIKDAWVLGEYQDIAASFGATISSKEEFEAFLKALGDGTDATENVTNAELTSITTNTTGVNGWSIKYPSPDGDHEGFNSDTNCTEMINNDGDLYQTVSDLTPGLYKVTVQGFIRHGWYDTCFDYVDYDLSYAKLCANDYEINLVPWAWEATKGTASDLSDSTPNDKSTASTAFSEGKYNNTLYTVVGEDGTLSIEIDCTGWVSSEWVAVKNLTLTYYGNPVTWEMTEAGWGTMILPFDATLPEELTAYSTGDITPDTDDDDATLSLNEVTASDGKITLKANTPYIMAGTAGTYTFTGTPVDATSLTSGKLTGTYELMDCDALLAAASSNTVYLLQNHDDVVAFYPVVEGESSEATLTPYHCYLTLSDSDLQTTSVPAKLSFSFGGEATAIEAVEGAEAEGNGAIYDLSGRKVSKAVKGVYIQNGKKVLVK